MPILKIVWYFNCRTDVKSYDIDELYEFADKTGILERHKQLLAKPYHDSQVRNSWRAKPYQDC